MSAFDLVDSASARARRGGPVNSALVLESHAAAHQPLVIAAQLILPYLGSSSSIRVDVTLAVAVTRQTLPPWLYPYR